MNWEHFSYKPTEADQQSAPSRRDALNNWPLVKTLIALLLVLLTSSNTAYASNSDAANEPPPFIIAEDAPSADLTHAVKWLEDKSRTFTIDKISSADFITRFQPNNAPLINHGYTDSAIWLYLPINRQGESPDTVAARLWLLQINYPQLDLIDIYARRQDNSISHLQLGDSLPYQQRPYKDPSYIAPVSIAPGETVEIFIRVTTSGSMQVPLRLLSTAEIPSHISGKNTAYGAFYGVMLVMAIYNLFIYLSTRDKSYLYYVLYVLSFSLFQSAISGHGFAYLWPNSMNWNQLAIPVFISLCCLFASTFSRYFLDLKSYAPTLDLLLKANGLVALGLFFSSLFLPVGLSTELTIISVFATTISVLSAGLISLKHKFWAARFFVLAWFSLIPGSVMHALAAADIITANAITLNSDLIGSLFEVILLSLALADRINVLRKENQEIILQSQQKLEFANTQLNNTLDQLEKSNQLKDQFLATISHELRTPMNGVEGSLNLIDSDKLKPRQQEYLASAKLSARNMTSVVDSILSFSEMQSGQLIVKKQIIDLASTLQPLANESELRCQQKGLTFQWQIDHNLPKAISTDSDQLILILKQLIDNAIKFTSQGQVSVNISSGMDEHSQREMLSCSIIDSGSGIAKEQINQIFTPFQQLDANDNRQHNGLGIGLAICNQIAAYMGGKLCVQSQPGSGSEFTLLIPLVPAYPQDTTIDITAPETQQRQKTVLIAEDNLVNQMVLKAMLQQMGCMIITANNGADVSQLLDQQPVDLIMMDCQMPLIDGFEATRRIRNSQSVYSNIPIIAVTANAMSGDSQRCLNAGMNDYIKKPVDRIVVERKVKQWLRNGKIAAV
ncbi:hybrid sensor histidine kinase/response regulator [Oceanicoccus sp. KOV_DT_Chl]|uniref:hybrid sensor histidine kinase/response regulator n=1 Tax=Oceanicoccus sp. KOV_DT_Chl TaxID=1904639 RepID=UPI00135CCBC6|nr:hybrid sensor histidine kinase/response regulator [Oceanicoccus sp. KOV_DT_Chl]